MSTVIRGEMSPQSWHNLQVEVGTGGGQATGERRRPEHLGTWAGDNRRRPGEAGQCQDTCTCPLAPDPPTYTSWVDWGGAEISWSFCTIQIKANDIILWEVCSWNSIERFRYMQINLLMHFVILCPMATSQSRHCGLILCSLYSITSFISLRLRKLLN